MVGDEVIGIVRTPAARLLLEDLAVESFDVGAIPGFGQCANPRCGEWDVLDEDGACRGCIFISADAAG